MKRLNIHIKYHLQFVHKLLMLFFVIMAICLIINVNAYHLTYVGQATIPFLQEGDYVVEVTYTGAGSGSSCILYSDQAVSGNNLTGEPLAEEALKDYTGIVRLQLHLEKGTYGIETRITSGDAVEIQRIEIQSVQLPNSDSYFLAVLFLLLALLTFCLGSYVPLEKYRTIAILVGIGESHSGRRLREPVGNDVSAAVFVSFCPIAVCQGFSDALFQTVAALHKYWGSTAGIFQRQKNLPFRTDRMGMQPAVYVFPVPSE